MLATLSEDALNKPFSKTLSDISTCPCQLCDH